MNYGAGAGAAAVADSEDTSVLGFGGTAVAASVPTQTQHVPFGPHAKSHHQPVMNYSLYSSDGQINVPALVVYVVDPFDGAGAEEQSDGMRKLLVHAVLRWFQHILRQLHCKFSQYSAAGARASTPDAVRELLDKDNVYVELIPRSLLVGHHRAVHADARAAPEALRNALKATALSLYARVRLSYSQYHLTLQQSHSLTGFGPSAARDRLLRQAFEQIARQVCHVQLIILYMRVPMSSSPLTCAPLLSTR